MTGQDFEAYETACQKIRADNAELLAGFNEWLKNNHPLIWGDLRLV